MYQGIIFDLDGTFMGFYAADSAGVEHRLTAL